MPQSNRTSPSLSDISHLFLSSVREKQTGGAAMPMRRPPGPARDEAAAAPAGHIEIDLTPPELQDAFHEQAGASASPSSEPQKIAPVSAILASHLGAGQFEAARRYARNLASEGLRVGLVAIDVCEFRLMMFEPCDGPEAEPMGASETGVFDARAIADALNEVNCDVDCWMVLVENPRVAEARAVLSKIPHWVILSACSHDAVVACYRTLKGLSDMDRPRVSLAAVDAKDPGEADQVYRKLSSVCGQFLDWRVEPEPPVTDVSQVTEIPLMTCRTSGDKAQIAAAKHWGALAGLLGGVASGPDVADASFERRQSLRLNEAQAKLKVPVTMVPPNEQPAPPEVGASADVDMELEMPKPMSPFHSMPASAPSMTLRPHAPALPEVIDLPEGELNDGVIAAMMRHAMNEVIECPVRPPMCPQARLAITRDRRIVVIAVAGQGLHDLRAIGLAYRWVVENRVLLSMALPQFALDVHQHPHLRLLVDQLDAEADILQPIFQVDTVSIHTYRRVRWGQRTGLLLNAA